MLFTWAFAEIADKVRSGATQGFDDAILHWMGTHQSKAVQTAMLEVTSLGTGTVVGMIVFIAGMFSGSINTSTRQSCSSSHARRNAARQFAQDRFNRPRPQIFQWGTYAVSSSFPSGHAMSSVIVYGTVAYLAARLQQTSRRVF